MQLARWQSLFLILFGAALSLFSAHAQELVYDNTATFINSVGYENREYGDELNLVGVDRTVTTFDFYYYGDFTAQGDEFAKIRFYRNDDPLSPQQIAPGTLLWESASFPVYPGYNTNRLQVPNIVVPANFTFTILFEGLTMTVGDRAGLLAYDPIAEGFSYNDFWRRNDLGQWRTAYYQSNDSTGQLVRRGNNFAARVYAITVLPRLNFSKSGSNLVVSWAPTGESFLLEASSSLGPTADWQPVDFQSNYGVNSYTTPISGGPVFFRLRRP